MDFKNDYEAKIPNDPAGPPPPYTTDGGSQVFDVNYIDWVHNIFITDASGQKLYAAVGGKCSSTRLEIIGQNGQTIGNTKRSSLSSKVEVQMTSTTGENQEFEMHNSAGVLGGSPKYTSPAFGGEVRWENKAMSSKIIYTLIDGSGMGVAKFESDPKTHVGKLELMDASAGEERFNEIAVTLLTLLQRKMKNIQASYIAAVT